MKYLYLLLLFLFTLNCSINKVSNTHGQRFLDQKFDKIFINKSNKNDVIKYIGPASSKSKFDDMWFYIERKKTNQSLFKLGKKKISKNNILIVEFNNKGLVENKSLLNVDNMNDIEIAETKTKKKFSQNNLVYNILSTLREKINAPTRRQKKSGGP
tara:strand:- start:583 stop:1050 length:468 start_codon:yes stop_codon:yes gene_type:complete